ncbi:MAG: peptide chain release factor N(5)-glutamine methyltransferase [Halanaerobiaceae bacterium]
MNIKTVLKRSEAFLKKNNISNPRLDAEVLLSDLLDMERIKLYVNYDYPLTEKELNEYRKRIVKRGDHIPVAYITGHKEFMSLDIAVNKKVLLPRPETELLVEKIIDWCKEKELESPNIVDVGTGSGAILVSLGYYIKKAKILGIDISQEALEIARKNIKKHEMQERLKVIQGDLLRPLLKMNKTNVDVVVSNPPYIKKEKMETLPPEVKKEPDLALNGGKDGVEIYKKLIPQAFQVLKENGFLILEIGEDQGEMLKNLLQKNKWHQIEIKKDYADKERIVMALKRS